MPNRNSPSLVELLYSKIDGSGLSNSKRRQAATNADSVDTLASIPTLSVPGLKLSLHRATAGSGNGKQPVDTLASIPTLSVPGLKLSLHRATAGSGNGKQPAAPFNPHATRLEQAITRSPGGPRPASPTTSASSASRSTLNLALRQETPEGRRRADQQGGADPKMAPPLATKANPVEFSEDTELREATVVGGSDQTSTVALMDLGWTFQLHSSPTSSKVIYLDFDGHTTTGTSFNNRVIGSSFYSPAYDINGNPAIFNNEELSRIQQIWQRVAADFAPFDVDVTTQAPPTDWLMKSNSTDPNYGIRAVITGYGPSSSSTGGVAIVNSFNAATDTPCFIYNKSLTGAAEGVSHEVGHSLGLSHDGTSSNGYYYGHGSGETSWAPIMGVGDNKNVTSWDNGTYYGSTNGAASANYGRGPNDMAVITTFNGFGYQLDQIGNDPSSAAVLTVAGGVVSQFGRIETSLDSDFYSFQLQGSGNVNLKFDPYCYRAYVDRDGLWGGSNLVYTAPVSDGNSGTAYADNGSNLDLAVGLYSSSGSLLGSFNGAGLATTLAWSNLAAGTYYVKLDGVGVGNPTTSPPNGYNDYASVGNYLITGTISNALNSGTPLSTRTALAPSSSTPTGVISPSGKAAIPAAAPRDSLTGIASGSVTSMAFQSDPLLDHRFAASALGSAAPGFPAAKVDNLQEGLITARAVTTLLGAVSEPSRSPFAGDLQTVLGALGLATERATAERPTWALA
ncbi:MAG: hypothetical protein RLZZ206_3835 [Cyanobacteriota bacterium]